MVQGDVVLECVHLDVDSKREVMMFRVMFNTAFIRSNILMLNCENLDILWDSKERYPKGFRAEVNIFENLKFSFHRDFLLLIYPSIYLIIIFFKFRFCLVMLRVSLLQEHQLKH